jgi:DNA-binding response OmpR family regulator
MMEPALPVLLVVEDDADTREVLLMLLEETGYRLESAPDGASGLARIEAGGIDLVLLDRMLPEIDGLELCRRVRARTDDPYLPILMLTALSDDQERHAGFAAGADDYVTKPFNADDLLDRVQVWIRTRQRLKEARARLLAQQEQLRELEQRALRERLSQDEAVIAMARTLSHELSQPLTVLIGHLELWAAGAYGPADRAKLLAELQEAAGELSARLEKLSRVVRYETTEQAGHRLIDLGRAQRQT